MANKRKPNPYPPKRAEPSVSKAPEAVPLPVRRLVQAAMEQLRYPGAIQSEVLKNVLMAAYETGKRHASPSQRLAA